MGKYYLIILYTRVSSLVILIFHMMTISGWTPYSSSIRLDLECLLWVQVFFVAGFHAILIQLCYSEIWLQMTRDGRHANGYPPVLCQYWPDVWRRNQPGCASICQNTSLILRYQTVSNPRDWCWVFRSHRNACQMSGCWETRITYPLCQYSGLRNAICSGCSTKNGFQTNSSESLVSMLLRYV